ncbi:hypothetical protein ABZT48_46550, partial [Streptomyces avermitilis]
DETERSWQPQYGGEARLRISQRSPSAGRALQGEMFSTRVRLSGMAIGTQIGFAVAGFAVTFAAQIAGPDGDNWSSVALFTSALCIPPIVAALSARETHKVPTELLGERAARGAANRETVTA